ncbi:MAG: T9SS type A sorting domain-containing protein [Balneolaceae bacterium]|nr:T9SS type A sorting domain-containing protein [Balneolaceae bacterium]
MRALLLFLLFVLTWNSSFSQEKYFHDLRGMEDSTGNTIIYIHEKEIQTDPDYPNASYQFIYLNKIDLNTLSSQNLFKEEVITNPLGEYYETTLYDYITSANHPDSIITYSYWYGMGSFGFELNRIGFDNALADGDFDLITNGFNFTFSYLNYDSESQTLFIPAGLSNQIDDSNFFKTLVIDKNALNSDSYPVLDTLDYTILFKDESYKIGQRFDSLFILTDTSTNFLSNITLDSEIDLIAFDSTNTLLFSEKDFEKPSESHFSKGDYLIKVSLNNPGIQDTLLTGNRVYLSNTLTYKKTAFVAQNNQIYKFESGRNQLQIIFQSNDEIKGLYYKPNSEILFFITSKDLIELNISTLESESLINLPASNTIQETFPYSITLHQNYPNPFNPSTVISYQLTGNSMVRLRVFDALGREVAVLVDELKSAGRHQVTFDAAGLASGVYYYLLEVLDSNERITQKMMLIK